MIDKNKLLLKILKDSKCNYSHHEAYIKVTYLKGVRDVSRLIEKLIKHKFLFKINNGLIIYVRGAKHGK